MTGNNDFTEKQSMALIRDMIEVSSRNIKKDGLLILIWGLVIFLGRFLNFFPEVQLIAKRLMLVFDVLAWGLGLGAIGFTIFYIYKQRKRTKTYIGLTARYTWVGILVVYNLVAIITNVKTGETNFEMLHPIQMSLIGLALFITGGLYREKLLLAGGLIYWVAAFIAVGYEMPYQFMIESIAGLLGFVIPGAWLYYQYRQRHV
ncbi:hypothetical protein [Roseimarinus sediminis]|uniref:hypothetical protein n=1 Tax=Roseimarinus sediminis TaxID=1610899 RepID=UPI003D1FF1F9